MFLDELDSLMSQRGGASGGRLVVFLESVRKLSFGIKTIPQRFLNDFIRSCEGLINLWTIYNDSTAILFSELGRFLGYEDSACFLYDYSQRALKYHFRILDYVTQCLQSLINEVSANIPIHQLPNFFC